jgi:integrase
MGRRRAGEPPRLLKHVTGQAYCTVAGKSHYFGRHGSAQAFRNYQDFLHVWQAEYGVQVVARADAEPRTLKAAAAAFLADVAACYSAGELQNIKADLDVVTDRFGDLRPDDFRPIHFKAVRSSWIAAGNARNTVNQKAGRILRFLKWCVGHDDELCRPETLATLRAVPPLPIGKAPESTPVEPVEWPAFVRSLKVLPRRLRAMAIVQFYSGPRPGEVCRMRGDEIIQGGSFAVGRRTLQVPEGAWLFVPKQHKKAKEGKRVIYFLGPKSQAALKPFLRANPAEYLFSPAEASLERKAKLRVKRKTKVQPSQADRARKYPSVKPGQHYTTGTYRQALHRALEAHGIEPWDPNQLRHSFVTRMDSLTDLLTASEAIGHKTMDTSLIYLQAKILKVAPIVARVG